MDFKVAIVIVQSEFQLQEKEVSLWEWFEISRLQCLCVLVVYRPPPPYPSNLHLLFAANVLSPGLD